MINPFVAVIAGPTGVGKTTISKMLSRHYSCAYISEDEAAKELFPEIYKVIEDYPERLNELESFLLNNAKRIFDSGDPVVIDRINLGIEFIEEIRKVFNKRLVLKILFPPVETTIERDERREGWTSGENAIKRYYKLYEELRPIIGDENYLDSGRRTPDETLEIIIADIEQNE